MKWLFIIKFILNLPNFNQFELLLLLAWQFHIFIIMNKNSNRSLNSHMKKRMRFEFMKNENFKNWVWMKINRSSNLGPLKANHSLDQASSPTEQNIIYIFSLHWVTSRQWQGIYNTKSIYVFHVLFDYLHPLKTNHQCMIIVGIWSRILSCIVVNVDIKLIWVFVNSEQHNTKPSEA